MGEETKITSVCIFSSVKGNSTKFPVQAVGYENRKGWLEVMEGREPVSALYLIP